MKWLFFFFVSCRGNPRVLERGDQRRRCGETVRPKRFLQEDDDVIKGQASNLYSPSEALIHYVRFYICIRATETKPFNNSYKTSIYFKLISACVPSFPYKLTTNCSEQKSGKAFITPCLTMSLWNALAYINKRIPLLRWTVKYLLQRAEYIFFCAEFPLVSSINAKWKTVRKVFMVRVRI